MSPYKAVTRNKPHCGLRSQLQDEFLNRIRTAENAEEQVRVIISVEREVS